MNSFCLCVSHTMRVLLLILIGLICGYHILLTGLAIYRPEMRVYLPLVRDALRVVCAIIISGMAIWRTSLRNVLWPFAKYIRPLLVGIGGFLIRAIIQTNLVWWSRQHMWIGIKYDIWFFFLWALAVVGWRRRCIVYSQKAQSWEMQNTTRIERIQSYVWRGILVLIVWGFARQWAKLVWPDRFMWFWYGPVGDYAYGANPPIWYRTWPGGTMRRSWIFAGPNNYGYFLVCFFWFFVVTARNVLQKTYTALSSNRHTILTRVSIAIYVWAVVLTFSRGAIIGCFVELLILALRLKHLRPLIWIGSVAVILGMGMLSISKRSSTLEHIQRTTQGIELVLEQPRWYGLWSAWPAIHRGWKYLPENIYIQVLLDTWRIWFIFRLCARGRWLMVWARAAFRNRSLVLWALRAWCVGLSVEWIFLHVREDSMVNMLFFGVWGVVLGMQLYMYSQRNAHHLHESES